MDNLQYYTSERFIHDAIVEEATRGIPSIYETWKDHRRIEPFVLSWPSRTIFWNAERTNQPVLVMVSPGARPGDVAQLLRDVQKKTAAYALLLWEQRAQAVVGVLESQHGSKSWHIPILDHSNVRVLGEPVEHFDVDVLGLKWELTG